jgi:hypothetical protein
MHFVGNWKIGPHLTGPNRHPNGVARGQRPTKSCASSWRFRIFLPRQKRTFPSKVIRFRRKCPFFGATALKVTEVRAPYGVELSPRSFYCKTRATVRPFHCKRPRINCSFPLCTGLVLTHPLSHRPASPHVRWQVPCRSAGRLLHYGVPVGPFITGMVVYTPYFTCDVNLWLFGHSERHVPAGLHLPSS